MSKISLIYDDFTTLGQTLYPNHSELVNPYDATLNDNVTLKAAWGYTIGPGFNTNKCAGKEATIERAVTFTLTRKIFAGPNRINESMTARKEAEKELLEDQWLLIQKLTEDTFVSLFTNLAKLQFESDNGVEFVRVGQFDLIAINSILIVEYFEHI